MRDWILWERNSSSGRWWNNSYDIWQRDKSKYFFEMGNNCVCKCGPVPSEDGRYNNVFKSGILNIITDSFFTLVLFIAMFSAPPIGVPLFISSLLSLIGASIATCCCQTKAGYFYNFAILTFAFILRAGLLLALVVLLVVTSGGHNHRRSRRLVALYLLFLIIVGLSSLFGFFYWYSVKVSFQFSMCKRNNDESDVGTAVQSHALPIQPNQSTIYNVVNIPMQPVVVDSKLSNTTPYSGNILPTAYPASSNSLPVNVFATKV